MKTVRANDWTNETKRFYRYDNVVYAKSEEEFLRLREEKKNSLVVWVMD